MTTRAFVLFSLLIFAAIQIIYDVWVDWKYGVGQTISWQTLTFVIANRIAAAIPGLILGILTAHLLTDRNQPLLSLGQPINAYMIAYVMGVSLGLLFWQQRGPECVR